MTARWLSMFALGCASSGRMALPAASAPLEDRLVAYRLNHIKADVQYSRHGAPHGWLGDDRAADPDSLAELATDSPPARAIQRWRAHDETATRWQRVAVGVVAFSATAEVAEYETMPHGRDRAAAMGLTWTGALVGVALTLVRAGYANHHAVDDSKQVLWDYNPALRKRLALCTRGLELVDCDAP